MLAMLILITCQVTDKITNKYSISDFTRNQYFTVALLNSFSSLFQQATTLSSPLQKIPTAPPHNLQKSGNQNLPKSTQRPLVLVFVEFHSTK